MSDAHKYRFRRVNVPKLTLTLDGIELVFAGENTAGEAMQFSAVVTWAWIGAFVRAARAFWLAVDKPSRVAEMARIEENL
jgi:hypothetical protein